MANQKIRGFLKGSRGQGMTEYIIIVALIAIAGITIFSLFGQQIKGVIFGMGNQLAGKEDAKTDTAGASGMESEKEKPTMGEF